MDKFRLKQRVDRLFPALIGFSVGVGWNFVSDEPVKPVFYFVWAATLVFLFAVEEVVHRIKIRQKVK